MYLGVLRDEERVKDKALALLASVSPMSSSSSPTSFPPTPPSSSTSPSTPSTQPAPVVDPVCATCAISPPPQIHEQQSKEARAAERRERLAEYEAQKGLADTLNREQCVSNSRRV